MKGREAHLWGRKTRDHQFWERIGMERKLAAIFSADVKGYSRLMGEDEAATVRAEPVRVYRVHLEPRTAAPAVRQPKRLMATSWRKVALVAVGLGLILGGGVTVWQLTFRRPAPAGVLPAARAATITAESVHDTDQGAHAGAAELRGQCQDHARSGMHTGRGTERGRSADGHQWASAEPRRVRR